MASLRNRLNGNILYWLSLVTRKSGRFQVKGLEHLEAAQAGEQPIIFTAWHGMTMMLVSFFSAYYDPGSIVLLLPDDWRGESLSVFASKLGAQPAPMDLTGDNTLATARKLAELVRQIRQGCDCYITPDGPDGPAYVVKPGIAYMAQKAGALILPLGAYTRHGYRLHRWDRYVVPYPFSRISIQVGAPVEVPKRVELTAVTGHLTDVLHRVTAQAGANYYEKQR